MQALAGVLLRSGSVVSGSDRSDSEPLRRLGARGAAVHVGHRAEQVPEGADLVVHSPAVPPSNAELLAARQRGVEAIGYAELLGRLMKLRRGVAIAGAHGKSTTTAMVAHVLRQAGRDPTFVVGATAGQLDGCCGVGGGPDFVAEACEYQRSFLKLYPKVAAVLNVEADHLDYYRDIEEIVSAFTDFVSLVPADGVVVVNADDRHAPRTVATSQATVERYGFETGLDWSAADLSDDRGRFRFTLLRRGEAVTRIAMTLAGRHNVSNALAAAAICACCDVGPEALAAGIGSFAGVHRRLTERGRRGGIVVADDYAHHPTEIQATLKAARAYYQPKRMWVIFQPHQHSRTRFLMEDFARSFSAADVIVIPDIYFVRDSEELRSLVSSADLVASVRAAGGEARYVADLAEVAEHVCADWRPGDLVLTMGAGDIWQVADELVARLPTERRKRRQERRRSTADAGTQTGAETQRSQED